jgi:hypothetical protein
MDLIGLQPVKVECRPTNELLQVVLQSKELRMHLLIGVLNFRHFRLLVLQVVIIFNLYVVVLDRSKQLIQNITATMVFQEFLGTS